MTFGMLSHCQKVQNPLVANGYLKPKGIQKAMIVLLQRNLHKKETLTICGMQDYKLSDTPVAKGDKFGFNQHPKNGL
ncbi:hypothetical protein CR513_56518, partial [Mucuna pruriens]